MLDRFEQDSGFSLPLSYQAFIKVFGPGELAYEYHIYAPGYPGNEISDLATINARIRESPQFEDFIRFFSDPDQIRRTVFFCGTGAGNWLGWDPADVHDQRQREYGIYEWGREERLRKLADSFPQFIEEVCLGPDPPGWDNKRLGTRRIFSPDCDVSGLTGG